MKAVLAKLGWEPMMTTPGEYATFIAGEVKKWPPLLRAAGLKPEG
jgi:tripartite-type tricarboxylate transporter receptor subunit TctC